ncbi:3-hydroxyacyl-ACP dehydratase FabZ [Pelagibius marinus]|uniref:3-hydroxyacyl-ACP dehydratase FabZ n=1 Tax=Pelagibius marinus TaxID=2762760 RepID=UPI0018731A78|nr:3-hydroxyacyl-ACP dehydratase FabZ [Pelagibius marinus]
MNKETSEQEEIGTLNVHDIMALLPHRYPFLMIDRVEDIVLGESATGIKNVTINEPFFQGHFPEQAVMPGVLLVEAMAQTAAALVMYTLGKEAHGKLVYFMTIDEARFRKPVVPGDTVRIQVTRIQNRRSVWKFKGEALVGDALVANASYSAMIVGY